MSEYQNNAVKLMDLKAGRESLLNAKDRREEFIRRSLELYYAMGGEWESIQPIAEKVYSDQPTRIDIAVGNVMYKLAAIGHVSDIDIIQAAYNKLDEARQNMSTPDNGHDPKQA
ncbi:MULTISPECIES: hypothetical protein [unclassified Rhizobium]|uniref:hypothetical protein n=1 Tax=unclassified Rhizobium TaxID=2613769 RepID=UPI0037FBF43F